MEKNIDLNAYIDVKLNLQPKRIYRMEEIK